MAADFKQLAKDIQALLSAVSSLPTYETEPPREKGGAVSVEPPFLVYSAVPQSKQDESGTYLIDLITDIWTRGGWDEAFTKAGAINAALDEQVYNVESGVIVANENGAIFNRIERDAADERLRRMQSQYVLRYYPNS